LSKFSSQKIIFFNNVVNILNQVNTDFIGIYYVYLSSMLVSSLRAWWICHEYKIYVVCFKEVGSRSGEII